MPAVWKSLATLRLFGHSLNPDEVTGLLGREPTTCTRKGDTTISANSGRQFVAKSGSWLLEATVRSPGDLDGQIAEILDSVTSDLSVWEILCGEFSVDMFCGLFLETSNNGLSLNPHSLRRLGERGIPIDIDIYAHDKED